MAGGVNLNDTIAIIMRVLQHHQQIINVWHQVTDLLRLLGLLPQQPSATAFIKANHTFDVKWVQSSLNQLIGTKLTVDGIMGPRTIDAVKQFQRQNGLDQDGWVGVLTLAKLEELTHP